MLTTCLYKHRVASAVQHTITILRSQDCEVCATVRVLLSLPVAAAPALSDADNDNIVVGGQFDLLLSSAMYA